MSALKATGSTRDWRRLRAWVLDRDGHRCQVPRADGQRCNQHATHVDHIVERQAGGTDAPDNLRAACAGCNLRRPGRATSTPTRRRLPRWTW